MRQVLMLAALVAAAAAFAAPGLQARTEYDYNYAWNRERTEFWIVGTDDAADDHTHQSAVPHAFLGRRHGPKVATELKIPANLRRGTKFLSFPIVIDKWLVATFYRDRDEEVLVAWETDTLRPLTLVSRDPRSLAAHYLRLRKPKEEGDTIDLQGAEVNAHRIMVSDFAANNKRFTWRRPGGK